MGTEDGKFRDALAAAITGGISPADALAAIWPLVLADRAAHVKRAQAEGAEQARKQALRDALKALDGHGFHDTAHARVRRLLACFECDHQPEQHEDDGRGACTARVFILGKGGIACHCAEWESP